MSFARNAVHQAAVVLRATTIKMVAKSGRSVNIVSAGASPVASFAAGAAPQTCARILRGIAASVAKSAVAIKNVAAKMPNMPKTPRGSACAVVSQSAEANCVDANVAN